MEANVAQLLRDRQNKFVEGRTVTEVEVNKFLKSLEALDEGERVQCKVVVGRTAKDVLPSLWQEPFNPEQYQAELLNLQNYIAGVKTFCDRINQEALACLQA